MAPKDVKDEELKQALDYMNSKMDTVQKIVNSEPEQRKARDEKPKTENQHG